MRKIWVISLLLMVVVALLSVLFFTNNQDEQYKTRFFKGEYFLVKEVEVNKGGATVGFRYDYFMVNNESDNGSNAFLKTNSPVDSLEISGLIIRIKTSCKIYSFTNVLWDKQLKLPIAVELTAENYR